MPAATRRSRLAPEQRRAQLIGLGTAMLAERTLEELSVEELAERAGISRALVFHYFTSKQDFHRAVAAAAAADFLRTTEPDAGLDPLDRLGVGLAAFVDYALDRRASYASMVRGAASGDAEVRRIVDEARTVQSGRILDGCAALGIEVSPRLALVARAWTAFADEAVIRWPAEESDPAGREQLVGLLTRSLLAALRAT